MLQHDLAGFYKRDLNRLIEEISLFREEENLWKTAGAIQNPAGNLVLHIVGGTNFLIGATLAQTGYVRNREQEFTLKGVPRAELVARLEALSELVTTTLSNFTAEDMARAYPRFFDKPGASVGYVVTQLALHLNYHLGQVNYLRRTLE